MRLSKVILLTGLILVIFLLGVYGQQNDYLITAVPFTKVKVDDSFWSKRLETNRDVTVSHCFDQSEKTGRINNFIFAGGIKKGRHEGYFFNDSDVYKVIQGAAYELALHPDPELDKYLDELISYIAAAQEDDGYLYTARTLQDEDYTPPGTKERWSNIIHGHELYCVGHLYEAAVAHFEATGKRNLLDVALKNAELHSGGTEVRIHFKCANGSLTLSIDDDGRGVPTERLAELLDRPGHLGLRRMRAVAARVGGTCFFSQSNQGGFRVDITLPIRIPN